MKMTIKTLLTLILPVTFIATSCNKDEKPPVQDVICTTTVETISNADFGDVSFKVSMSEFQNIGFDYMDLIDTTFDGVYIDQNNGEMHFDGTDEQSIKFERLPFVSNYNEVGYFAPCLCNYQKKNDWFEIAPGMHALKNYAQELYDNRDKYTVTFKLVERGGYKEIDDVVSCSTKISFEQADFNHDKFANVRDVTRVGNIKDKMKPGLYIRGSTPFDPKNNDNDDGRHLSADFLLGEYDVTHEISLATKNKLTDEKDKDGHVIGQYRPLTRLMIQAKDKAENTRKIFGVPDNEQTQGNNEYLVNNEDADQYQDTDTFFSTSMGSDYFTLSEDINKKLEGGDITLKVLEYFKNSIASKKSEDSDHPVFYLHCNEGKDRTGWFSMLIEALCGVSFGDIVHDFMLTFTNYYHKFNRYDEESIKMYDMMKIQTIYRFVYALTCENPIVDLSKSNWGAFAIAEDLASKGLTENADDTGAKMRDYAEKYVTNVLCKGDQNIAKPIYQTIQNYFSLSK